MTDKLRDAAQMALECLDWHLQAGSYGHDLEGTAAALRAALAEPVAEPVAWLKQWDSVGNARTGMRRVDLTPERETWLANMCPTITPLYTHTPPADPDTITVRLTRERQKLLHWAIRCAYRANVLSDEEERDLSNFLGTFDKEGA